MYLCKICYW